MAKIQKELEKRKKEERKRLLEPGFVTSGDVEFEIGVDTEEVDMLALAAAAKALLG